MVIFLLMAAVALAYANGANDNFKGVATLLGSRTATYRRALNWACWSTLAGSLTALWLAEGLLAAFSGKGLVPDAVAGAPDFLTAVGLGAAATVLIATQVGLPISTTHALTGALVGAGIVHTAGAVNFLQLGSSFLLPLLASPLMAMGATVAAYLFFRMWRLRLRVDKESCICVGQKVLSSTCLSATGESVLKPLPVLQPEIGSKQHCEHVYLGHCFGLSVAGLLDRAHYLSAGAVSFARGLNDTPKIAALLLAAQALAPASRFALVGLMIALGGWLSARKVADTVSHRVTAMNAGQGFSANLVTALLVIGASRFGLPVSTTHVSVGSLIGIGVLTGGGHTRVIRNILFSWAGTLPLAAALSALMALAL